MPYIPKEHEKYNLLPLCRERGGEVIEYPCDLLDELEEHIPSEDQLTPYGFKSYEEYNQEIDRIARRFLDQPQVMDLFAEFKTQIYEMNRKEQWSVLKYIGTEIDGLTPGRNYYWPSSFSNPVYRGVVDDEEFTSYLYPTDADLWEILEDPTGMAYNTIYGKGKGKMSKATHDHIMEQLKNAVVEEENDMWIKLPFEPGELGSENGVLLADEEYKELSRITLEKCPEYYAITCGVYGSMVHTAFCDEENYESTFRAMKKDLAEFIDADLPSEECWEFYDRFAHTY